MTCPTNPPTIFPVMKTLIRQLPNTILFNIACYTVLGMTKNEAQVIYDEIENWMNGDGLYEGCDKEAILEAYYDQHSVGGHWTWVDLVRELASERCY